jgi:sugar lactone lactonase YvrE
VLIFLKRKKSGAIAMLTLIRSGLFILAAGLLTSCSQKQEQTPTVVQKQEQTPTAVSDDQQPHYKVTTLVPGSPFHGIHGLTFDADDNILVGSVVGMNIHKVNPDTGAISLYQGPPEGMADDLEFSADGTLVWTAIVTGDLYARSPDGSVTKIASGLPGLNAVAFKQDGRLFATLVFLGDALYEFDITGETPPRLIMENMGGLNGFDFGPDGKLYGPIWFKGQIVRVDVDTAELTVVAEGFKVPAAANFDSKGILHVIDNETGEIFQVDIESGEKHLIATAPTNLDNLAFDSKDRLFVTNMSDNAIYEVNRESGELRQVVGGPLTTPAGISLDGDTLYIADLFSFSKVNVKTGEVSDVTRIISDHEYPVSVTANGEHLIIGSSNAGMVQGYDKQTEQRIWRWSGFSSPGGLLELNDGSVIVAETGTGKVLKVSGAEGETREVLAENLAEPVGLALSADGKSLYVTDAGSGQIIKMSMDSGDQKVIQTGLSMPEGIAIDASGALFIVEAGARRILKISPGGASETIADELPLGLKGYPGLPPSFLPSGIALDEDGVVYVSSDIDNTILQLTP